jgi:SRSO17 transposase
MAIEEQIKLKQKTIEGTVRDLSEIKIIAVDQTSMEATWNYMVREYHYLGCPKIIGPRIKYLVLAGDRPIAALSYNQASLSLGVREKYIGWDQSRKNEFIPHIVNNNRFLILPWVKIKNLASHLLSQTLKLLKKDWLAKYNCEPYMAETFVDLSRNKGICYRAANWVYLGQTKGYSKAGKTFVYHGNPKGVYIYVLDKKFQRVIDKNTSKCRTLEMADREKLMMMLQTPDWHPGILEEAGITPENVSQIAGLLLSYMSSFKECFSREVQYKHALCYVKGLLSDLDRKSIEPIALRYAEDEKEVRNMQYFSQNGAWDEQKMLKIYHGRLSDKIADPDAMITVDDSGFPKKGKESVGVARQYCGQLGKTDNCQDGVFVGYSSALGYGLLQAQLYLPEKWFEADHDERREKCGIPKNIVFKTKSEIATELIQNIAASGAFPARWIGADSAYGSDQSFLDSLPEGFLYFAEIHKNITFFKSMPEVSVPPYKGKGKIPTLPKPSFPPVSAESIANDPQLKWEKTYLGEGAKGPIYSDTACTRVIVNRDGLPAEEIWLYLRRLSDGTLKFSKSNATADTPKSILDAQATRRWPIEQCFEECKSQLGMGHCESRSWDSWHRHMILVFVAYLFILELRFKFMTKHPILTLAQAQRLVIAAFNGVEYVIKEAIKIVAYHLKRNYWAYFYHKRQAEAAFAHS